jgi:hypothetical protein
MLRLDKVLHRSASMALYKSLLAKERDVQTRAISSARWRMLLFITGARLLTRRLIQSTDLTTCGEICGEIV